MKLGEAWVYINGDDKPLQGVFRKTRGSTVSWATSLAQTVRQSFGTMLTTAGGFVLAQLGIQGVAGAARTLRGAIFDMNSVLETTGLQFETLQGDADAAREHVKDLFDFAKLTPFETQPIIDASLQLQNYGREALNTRETLTMIGDAAAATNAPIEELGRWVGRAYSAIQMGRPFGEAAQRLQELAVISPEARVEMERLQAAGASADQVWAVLTRDMERFNGAMLAQANTWTGLTATISDSIKLLSATAMEPLFELAKRGAKTLADMFSGGAAEAFAQRVAAALRGLIDWVTRTARTWLDRMASMEGATARSLGRIAGFIVGLARQAIHWGGNIVSALASGIMGAVGLIQKAIQFIGNIIGYWLKPGSPPRLLPDLDQWGKAAAEVWLGGWPEASFQALEDFGGRAAAYLQALAGAGRMDAGAVVPALLDTRQAFADLLEEIRTTGTVSEETFARLREAAGPAGEQVEALARGYARVAGASAELAAVQRRLAGMQAQEEARSDAARRAQLGAIIADPRATAAQRERARREMEYLALVEQERRLQGEVQAAGEDLAAYESRLDVETETLRLLEEETDAAVRLALALGGGGGAAGGGAAAAAQELEDAIAGVNREMEELKGFDVSGLEGLWKEITAGFGEGEQSLDNLFSQENIETAMGNLGRALGQALGLEVGEDGNFLWRGVGAKILEKIGEGALALSFKLVDVTNAFREWAESDETRDGLTAAARTMTEVIIGALKWFLGDDAEGIQIVGAIVQNISRAASNLRNALVAIGVYIAAGIIEGITGTRISGDIVAQVVGMVQEALRVALQAGAMMGPWSSGEYALPGQIPGHATGTPFSEGGWATVGELGPELVRLPRGSAVYPHSLSRQMLATAGGGAQPIIVQMGGVMIANDMDAEELAFRVAREVQRRSR